MNYCQALPNCDNEAERRVTYNHNFGGDPVYVTESLCEECADFLNNNGYDIYSDYLICMLRFEKFKEQVV